MQNYEPPEEMLARRRVNQLEKQVDALEKFLAYACGKIAAVEPRIQIQQELVDWYLHYMDKAQKHDD